MRYVLTEDQKRDIREKYLNNINKINRHLPQGKMCILIK